MYKENCNNPLNDFLTRFLCATLNPVGPMQQTHPKVSVPLCPTLHHGFQAWDAARNGLPVPYRHALDPRNLGGTLENIFILEERSDFDFRFRICGQRICDLIGMEMRGMPAVSIVAPEFRQGFTDVMYQISTRFLATKLDVQGQRCGSGASILLLPMLGPTGKKDRILGVATTPRDAMPPNRFEILSVENFDLSAMSAAQQSQPECGVQPNLQVIAGGRANKLASPRPNLKLVN